ncbi:hypothetical protein PCE1_002207 [Barthelona sp. PCE]
MNDFENLLFPSTPTVPNQAEELQIEYTNANRDFNEDISDDDIQSQSLLELRDMIENLRRSNFDLRLKIVDLTDQLSATTGLSVEHITDRLLDGIDVVEEFEKQRILLKDAKETIENLESENQELKDNLVSYEQEFDIKKTTEHELITDLRQQKDSLTTYEETVHHLQTELQTEVEQTKTLNNRIQEMETREKEFTEEKKMFEQNISELQLVINNLNENVEELRTASHDEMKKAVADEQTRVHTMIDNHKAIVEEKDETIQQLELQISKVGVREVELSELNSKLVDELDQMTQKLENMYQHRDEQEETQKSTENKLIQQTICQEAEISDLQAEMHEMKLKKLQHEVKNEEWFALLKNLVRVFFPSYSDVDAEDDVVALVKQLPSTLKKLFKNVKDKEKGRRVELEASFREVEKELHDKINKLRTERSDLRKQLKDYDPDKYSTVLEENRLLKLDISEANGKVSTMREKNLLKLEENKKLRESLGSTIEKLIGLQEKTTNYVPIEKLERLQDENQKLLGQVRRLRRKVDPINSSLHRDRSRPTPTSLDRLNVMNDELHRLTDSIISPSKK